jgi:protein TonB
VTFSILAAALLVQPAPPPPGGPQWTLAASNEEGEYWLDQASLRNQGALYRFRVRVRLKEEGRDEIRSALVAYQLDCSRQSLAMESLEAFDEAGEVVATRTVPSWWLDKDPIYPGSFQAQFYARICPAPRRQLADRPPPPPMIIATPAPPLPPPVIRMAPPAPPPPPPPPPRGGYPATRATPVVPLHTLFSADDYPAAALRAEEEGLAAFKMTIDKEGRMTGCEITSSSGSASLDSTTCRLIRARARFRPARNARGKKMADVVYGRILWRFPDEPVPTPQAPPAQ